MRLLDVQKFPPSHPQDKLTYGEYAILSHTWREDEVVFSDLVTADLTKKKPSWGKIQGAQSKAAEDGLSSIWIDTVCIDKSSSAELGEAINSMWRWYQHSKTCYVYLDDVEPITKLQEPKTAPDEKTIEESLVARMSQSRWFKRGWTLQELIAPSDLRFYDSGWNLIGTMQTPSLAKAISQITRIHLSMILHERKTNSFSIAQRMSWAADRSTTRLEDRAYSLLGILDLSLDIRYGEGSRAFIRLQEEIIQRSDDQSIFAWELRRRTEYVSRGILGSIRQDGEDCYRLLALSPDVFIGARDIVPTDAREQSPTPYRLTNTGLSITAPVVEIGGKDYHSDRDTNYLKSHRLQVALNCRYENDPTVSIFLNLDTAPTVKRLNQVQKCDVVQMCPDKPAHLVETEGLGEATRLATRDSTGDSTTTTNQELLIARSKDELTFTPRSKLEAWLQLRLPSEIVKLESAEPEQNDHTRNMTWSTILNHSSDLFTVVMNLRVFSEIPVPVRVCVIVNAGRKGTSGWMDIQILNTSFCETMEETRERTRLGPPTLLERTRPRTPSLLPISSSTAIADDLKMIALLSKEHVNGQDLYLLKVSLERPRKLFGIAV